MPSARRTDEPLYRLSGRTSKRGRGKSGSDRSHKSVVRSLDGGRDGKLTASRALRSHEASTRFGGRGVFVCKDIDRKTLRKFGVFFSIKMQEENERKYIYDVYERRRESSYTVCVRPFATAQKMLVSSRNLRAEQLPHLANFGLTASKTFSTYQEVRLKSFSRCAPKLVANEKLVISSVLSHYTAFRPLLQQRPFHQD